MSIQRLDARAEDDLRFIRKTMERSTQFTAVSGWGGVAMGVAGLVATAVASPYAIGTPTWILVWLTSAAVAAPMGAWSIWRKAERTGVGAGGVMARKFALCFFPVVAAGVILTWALVRSSPTSLPAAWLSLYGAAIMAGGAFSVPALPVMGAAFLGLGAFAAMFPALGAVALLLGFGVLQVGFGAYLAARYDG